MNRICFKIFQQYLNNASSASHNHGTYKNASTCKPLCSNTLEKSEMLTQHVNHTINIAEINKDDDEPFCGNSFAYLFIYLLIQSFTHLFTYLFINSVV